MTDIFDPNGQPEAPNPESNVDPLDALVGEGKKFKTVQDLAKSKLEADSFVEQLKEELHGLRRANKELEQKIGVRQSVNETLNNGEGNPPEKVADPEPSVDVSKLVDERFKHLTAEQRAEANRKAAQSRLIDYFNGDEAKARAFVKEEAAKLNVSAEHLRTLSSESPDAFLRLVGVTQAKAPSGVSFESGHNPEADASGPVRNAAYYTELRKKMGDSKFFADVRLQQQRFKDKMELGSKF